jgi:hypothetical protein
LSCNGGRKRSWCKRQGAFIGEIEKTTLTRKLKKQKRYENPEKEQPACLERSIMTDGE